MTEIIEMFKSNGRKGGLKRAANMSKKARSESARRAARIRWSKKKGKTK